MKMEKGRNKNFVFIFTILCFCLIACKKEIEINRSNIKSIEVFDHKKKRLKSLDSKEIEIFCSILKRSKTISESYVWKGYNLIVLTLNNKKKVNFRISFYGNFFYDLDNKLFFKVDENDLKSWRNLVFKSNLITAKSVGEYSLGQKIDFNLNSNELDFTTNSKKEIRTIVVNSEKYKTFEGFGVNTHFSDLRENKTKLTEKEIEVNKGQVTIGHLGNGIMYNNILFVDNNEDHVTDFVLITKN